MVSPTLRRGIAAASSLLLAGVAFAAVPADATTHVRSSTRATAARSAFGSTVHYALVQPLCAVPKDPMAMRCFAERLVHTTKGTPGARAYRMANNASLGPAGGYTPGDIASAYGVNPTLPRSNQTVAVVNWFRDPNALRDLDAFDAYYHLRAETAATFRQVSQTGGSVSSIKTDEGAAGEQSLDIEAIRGLCHSCKIILVEAKNGDDTDIAAAENEAARLGATEINNSFGEPERKYPANIIAAYNHPGIVITASTGDAGWFGWDYANAQNGNSQNAAEYPSTSPYVVSVGGTELAVTSAGKRGAEIAWNENGLDDATGLNNGSPQGAGGGGCSKYFTAPAWQRAYPGYANARCNGKRLAADVAADADANTGLDVYDSFHPSHPNQANWQTIGGTSLAAPLTAAMFALAGGSGGTAYPASAMYVNARAYPSSVFDVVPYSDSTGAYPSGNGFCGGDTTTNCANAVYQLTSGQQDNPNGLSSGQLDCSFPRAGGAVQSAPALDPECNTVRGFDGPTGLGTPNSARLYTRTNPSLVLHGSTSLRVRGTYTYTVAVHEFVGGTSVVRYSWNWGDGHTTTTTSPSTRHAFTKSGRFTVSVSVSTNRYQTSNTSTRVTVSR